MTKNTVPGKTATNNSFIQATMNKTIYSTDQIGLMVEKFKTATLPKVEWTHEAHLIIAIWHINNHELHDAISRLKSGIIILNSSHKTENTGNSGYHETLTIFWAKVISLFLSLNKNTPTEDVVSLFLTSKLSERTLPFKFYKREELLSPEPRAIYILPTLRKLDELAISEIIYP